MRKLCTIKCLLLCLLCCAAPLAAEADNDTAVLDLGKVFAGAPIIYSTLLAMSIFSFILWLYTLLTLRLSDMMPHAFMDQLRSQVYDKRYEAALQTCQQDDNFFSRLMSCGLSARRHGPEVVMETIQAEGKRRGLALWQRVSLLNDIALTAPMLGLLGTVLGMFYAFYDSKHTADSLATIFDGLGIAIGTTVAGLIVSILSSIFYTVLKIRIVKLLNVVECEALALGNHIDRTPTVTESQI